MKKWFFTISICLFSLSEGISQLVPERLLVTREDRANPNFSVGKIEIDVPLTDALTNYFQVVDTLESNNEQDLIRVEVMGISFGLYVQKDSIRRHSAWGRDVLHLESRVSPYMLWEYDITGMSPDSVEWLTRELRNKPYDLPVLRGSVQNCFSYALECVFRLHGIDPEPFFFQRSSLTVFEDMDMMLDRFFILTDSLDVSGKKELRKLKESETLAREVELIVFRNPAGDPMHAFVNWGGKAWTKNGMAPYTSVTPYDVVYTYHYAGKPSGEFFRTGSVEKIEFYRFLPERLRHP